MMALETSTTRPIEGGFLMRARHTLIAISLVLLVGCSPYQETAHQWSLNDVVAAWSRAGKEATAIGSHLESSFEGTEGVHSFAVTVENHTHSVVVFPSTETRKQYTLTPAGVASDGQHTIIIKGPNGWEVQVEFRREPKFFVKDNILFVVSGEPPEFEKQLQAMVQKMGR